MSGQDDGVNTGVYIRALVESAIRNQPRSLQKQIGPSEIGNPCDHCLAARLAGWEKRDDNGVAWLPFIGTSVHAQLEKIFNNYAEDEHKKHPGLYREFYAEQRVCVGTINGQEIWGSTDLYRAGLRGAGTGGITIDWKIVGDSTLKRVKANRYPGEQYEVQAHLYARGWSRGGFPTSHVAIYFMPRNKASLDGGYWWTAPYDEQKAVGALKRAEKLATTISTLESVAGVEARDNWISGLDRATGCWDCMKYADWAAVKNKKLF